MGINQMEVWLDTYFDSLSPRDFYRVIFPAGELEKKGEYHDGQYTGIAISVGKIKVKGEKPKVRRYSVTDDLDVIDEMVQSDEFCLMSPIAYAGKNRSAENARFLYAMAFDLDMLRFSDDGSPAGLISLWNGHILQAQRLPKPTLIVSSGQGLHLYYVYEQAVPMFENVAKQLQTYKRELTRLLWNEGIVRIKDDREIQQEGIYQGFRMPGTITKDGGRARAFHTGDKVTIEYMNSFVEKKYQVTEFRYKSKLTLADAKQKYPTWYQERIVEKKKGILHPWHVSRRLYDWWKRTIKRYARVNHRYFCLMMLVIYGRKCGFYDAKHNPNPVTYEEIENDCWELMEYFETLTVSEDNHFTEIDVQDALEAYNERWLSYPRASIAYKAGIEIPRNIKRKGQKQADHLEEARAIRDIRMKRQGRKWSDGGGRKSKKELVQEWRVQNPSGRKVDCIRELKLSKPTVYKWWDIIN